MLLRLVVEALYIRLVLYVLFACCKMYLIQESLEKNQKVESGQDRTENEGIKIATEASEIEGENQDMEIEVEKESPKSAGPKGQMEDIKSTDIEDGDKDTSAKIENQEQVEEPNSQIKEGQENIRSSEIENVEQDTKGAEFDNEEDDFQNPQIEGGREDIKRSEIENVEQDTKSVEIENQEHNEEPNSQSEGKREDIKSVDVEGADEETKSAETENQERFFKNQTLQLKEMERHKML